MRGGVRQVKAPAGRAPWAWCLAGPQGVRGRETSTSPPTRRFRDAVGPSSARSAMSIATWVRRSPSSARSGMAGRLLGDGQRPMGTRIAFLPLLAELG